MYGYGGLHVSSYYFSVINHRVFFNDTERESTSRQHLHPFPFQKTQPTVTFGNLSAVYQSTGSLEDIRVRTHVRTVHFVPSDCTGTGAQRRYHDI